MNKDDWKLLCDIVDFKKLGAAPVGFIIDSPWLPEWYDVSHMNFYRQDNTWLNANLKAIQKFSDVMFLPGFWAEFGMCTEPSAFGSKPIWSENDTPHPAKVISDIEKVDKLEKPDPEKHGLLPFVLNRLEYNKDKINNEGHQIKFAVARGPFNIAAYLVGHTEFLVSLKSKPDKAKKLIELVSEFIVDWLQVQKARFKSIEGIFVLDDIIGFVNEDDFREFALPYFKEIYDAFDTKINFLHNDMESLIPANYLNEIGVNLYNFSHEHSFKKVQKITNEKVALVGNIPPRDILAEGTPEEIKNHVKKAINSVVNLKGILLSCGGGMPPGVTSENINAFVDAVKENI
ncbi:uroporphyrinogen decarboxylase family protein [Halarsenatibacter silvermanii]|uniref:Uroporphyrinogen decarboxylase n=1 Tax=Halarsenatibacter silvermanii TaxID=321763 RepID=A0A1G9RKT1_9FIRM|nr:uroporphyrinogen decarboxylase family protein [Halarsenatibacter silvermanii]SDM23761.1 uroporphyrinogen decarboxylase [Halarsenatibacter silvermanii]